MNGTMIDMPYVYAACPRLAIRRRAVSVAGALVCLALWGATPIAAPRVSPQTDTNVGRSYPTTSRSFGPGRWAEPTGQAVAHAAGRPIYVPFAARRQQFASANTVLGLQISELRFRQPEMIRAVRQAGAGWWRTFMFWDEIEPERGSPPKYDWSLYDPLFQQASQAGLTVIAEVQGNPPWAADFPGGPPKSVDTLAQFLTAAAERYDGDGQNDAPGSPRVRYWEIYNEPDNTDAKLAREGRGWGYWGWEGVAYARMLAKIYPAIKRASPQAQVVFGGIAYDAFLPNDGPFNRQFLDDALSAGAGPYFDVMNFHYYPLFAYRWQSNGPGLAGKTETMRKKLAAYRLSKPILVTEAGIWSGGSPPYPATNEQEQARYVPQLYAEAIKADVLGAVWFQYDDVAGFDDPARGLVDKDLATKPALAAFRVASAELAGAVADPSGGPSGPGVVYWLRSGNTRIAVAWTLDGSPASLDIAAPVVERVHYLGTRLMLKDEADGVRDGHVHVPYGADPVYLRVDD